MLSLYLQYIKGLTPQAAGVILVAQPIMMALVSPLAGRLSDRLEARIVASTGMALTAVGLLMLVFLTAATPFPYIVAALLLLGVGFGLFSSPNMNAIMGSAEKRLYGVASAIVATMRTLGQMLSLGIALLIFSVVIGRVQITSQYTDKCPYQHPHRVFGVYGVVCLRYLRVSGAGQGAKSRVGSNWDGVSHEHYEQER